MRRPLRLALWISVAFCSTPASAEGLASMSRGDTFEEQGGPALYAGVCAACHMPGGEGAAGAGAYPALAGDASLASKEGLVYLLFNGRGGMPPVGRLMSDPQVADVINYVRARFGGAPADEVTAADAKAARPAAGWNPE
jgi:mono/diheme cytochrome c family protein